MVLAKSVTGQPVTPPQTGALYPRMRASVALRRLGKPRLKARQLSTRGGTLDCEEQGERVLIRGRVTPYLEGVIRI